MVIVFVSYRRDDAAGETTHIYECLDKRFGGDNVFLDVDTIPPGADFREYICSQVARCDVMLVVIGREWLVDRHGKRPVDDPTDFVRIEIEMAMKRGIRIIPVLVRGASMPGDNQLPDSIRQFAFRNALQVRAGQDFRTDVDRLIRAVEVPLAESESERSIAGRDPDRQEVAFVKVELRRCRLLRATLTPKHYAQRESE